MDLRSKARFWLCAAWAAALPCLGQSARDERQELQERLARQRAALLLLKDQKVSVLEVMERAERIARSQMQRAQAVDQEMRAVRRRVELLERQQRIAHAAQEFQLARLGPRLRVMYRLTRARGLESLLSAEDFSSLVWRSRAMGRLLAEDLELLGRVQRAARFEAVASRQLGLLRQALGMRLDAVKREAQRAAEQKADFAELLQLIQAEQVQGGRVVRELEQAERELTSLIEEMEAPPAASGFGALKGRLPLPAEGRIEVGFGKVVNPRFNTVTVQKGVDLRAPLGTPVRAVADGRIAYAGWLRGYGNLLILDHGDGFHTVMAHLDEIRGAAGDPVVEGQEIATVGDTASLKGAYLYFEIRQKGIAADPALWLRTGSGAPR